MAKYIAEIILAGSRVLGRAFAKALKEEYAASQNAAKARAGSNSDGPPSRSESGSLSASGLSLEEAKQILDVSDIQNSTDVLKKYEHLFGVNDVKKGGSLYLQSKVFRAKERIDEELQSKAPSQGSSENEAPPSNRKTQSSRDS